MRLTRRGYVVFAGVAGLAVVAALGAGGQAQSNATSADDATSLAEEAYVFGYPLVTMEMTRRVMTNVAAPAATRAPMGRFVNMRTYPTAAFRDVTAPNADTLYSSAWIDLSAEPYVLSIPEMHDRYFLFPMLDAWTNVFQVPGKRTTGTHAQKYVIVGPDFTGTLPAGIKEYRSPTNVVWILGRIYCNGTPEDYDKVHQIQDQLALVPLSSYGRPYTPPPGRVDPSVDMKTPVRDQVNKLSGEDFFKIMAEMMKTNPAARADARMLAKLAKLGIVHGASFDTGRLTPEARQAIARTPEAAQHTILAHAPEAGRHVNGWTVTLKAGTYGTDYLQRAFVAWVGLGANRPEDAVYPMSDAAADGTPYTGANKYVMHFAKGETPPATGFWSLTMYDDQMFFVDNPLNKYTVSPRDRLHYNADGSLDLYLQHESPGKDKQANWLPAPTGRFKPMLRMYWPQLPVLNGAWVPPPIVKQSKSAATRTTTPPM
jgi:hypothetical protein